MDTKIVEKIRKLMNLAGNNSSQQEAQSALLKAQQLMAENNIEMSAISDMKPVKKEAIGEKVAGGAKTGWRRQLALIIAKNFRTEVVLSGGGFLFIGLKDDVQISISVFNYACDTLDKGMMKLRRDTRKAGQQTDGLSGDYATGFLSGLSAKFDEQVRTQGWGLILVKDPVVKDKLATYNVKNTNTTGTRLTRSGNSDIYNKGYEAGKSLGVQKQIKA